MKKKNIENVIKELERLYNESSQNCETAASGYDAGFYSGELNAYAEALHIIKEVSNDNKRHWTRWYVSEEQIPRLQDAVLICKGWYDENKYDGIYEALRAYWASVASTGVKYIGYDTVLRMLLLPACEAFLDNRKFCEIFYDDMYKIGIVHGTVKQLNGEYLIEILASALAELSKEEFRFEEDTEPKNIV